MIRDYQRYYGAALVHLLDQCGGPLSVRKAFADRNGYYVLEERLPLSIKFSRSRMGPWVFTFHREHQVLQNELVKHFGVGITAFVCGTDGVVALDHQQLRLCLDDNFEEQENISIRRKLRHMYSVRGRDGSLEEKISRDSFSKLVRNLLGP
ncbi:MAG: hypothetical protein R3C60_11795 [Parvularculaceae bacterium]